MRERRNRKRQNATKWCCDVCDCANRRNVRADGVCVAVAAFRGVGGWRYDAPWGNQRGKAAFCGGSPTVLRRRNFGRCSGLIFEGTGMMSNYTITTDNPYTAKMLIDLVILLDAHEITDDTLAALWSAFDDLGLVETESWAETSDKKRRGFIGKLRKAADHIESVSDALAETVQGH